MGNVPLSSVFLSKQVLAFVYSKLDQMLAYTHAKPEGSLEGTLYLQAIIAPSLSKSDLEHTSILTQTSQWEEVFLTPVILAPPLTPMLGQWMEFNAFPFTEHTEDMLEGWRLNLRTPEQTYLKIFPVSAGCSDNSTKDQGD